MRVLLLAFLWATAASAQTIPSTWKANAVTSWGGLNILSDSTEIDGDAQKAINVLTDSGYLEKRTGNTFLATILAGSPVKYVNDWTAPNGNRYLIAQASQTVYQTNFSGSPVIISSIASGFNITTTPAFSRLEFADGYRPLWYWNGNSTATVTDPSGNLAPTCTYIDYKDSRLWCANLPNGFSVPGNTQNGGGSSTVLISSSGGDGYWSVPSNVGQVDSTPNRFDFNPDDGDQITCLAHTPWGEFVGKRNSSYIVKGNGNLSYDSRILDSKIGCVDNRSVQMVYGMLKWLTVDGVYGYDATGPPRLLTRELDPLMAQVRESSFSQGQWATQLQPDWANSVESTTTFNLPLLPWDYNTIPGQIFPSSFTLYDDNTDPNLQTNGRAGFTADTLVNIDTTSIPLSIGLAQITVSSSIGIQVWLSSFPAGNFSTVATTWTVASGGVASAASGGFPFINGIVANSVGHNVIYTPAPSVIPSASGGWNYGSWSFGFVPELTSGAGTFYGACDPGGGNNECLEFNFISNMQNTGASSWSGYGISIFQSAGVFTANLFKEISGSRTNLGSYSYTTPESQNFPDVGLSSFTVTKSPGGYFKVFLNGVQVLSAFDNTAAANTATYSTFDLLEVSNPSGAGGVVLDNVKYKGFASSGTLVSRIYDTGMGAPLAGLFTSSSTLMGTNNQTSIAYYIRSSSSPNNDMWSSWTASSNSVLVVLPNRYWEYEALFNTSVASMTPQLGYVSLVGVTTGYYYSQVDFVGTLITSWRQFGVTENTPGVYGYAVRQATYSFSSNNTSIPWITQTANVNVNMSVSTPTYAQFRLDSTSLVSNPSGASAAESIAAIFLRWDQGQNLPVASDTLDRRYMLCVTISSAASAPDTCLIQQKTGKWVQWSNGGTIGAMGLYNNQMVAADGGTSSKVWRVLQAGVYNDDGFPIDAVWVSGDFTDGLVFNNKVLQEMWVDAAPVQASSVTLSYQYNKMSGWVDYQFFLDNGQGINPSLPNPYDQFGSLNQYIPLPGAGTQIGKYFRVKFEDNQFNDYYRIVSYLLYLQDQGHSIP